jgi:SAM-dependent methyltransferase
VEERRWIPYRLRIDKTKNYLENMMQKEYKTARGPNGMRTALTNYELIKNPITKEMLYDYCDNKKGGENRYYKGNKGDELELYRYNNNIKRGLYERYVRNGDRILELSGGRGGDLGKIINRDVSYVLFTNRNKEALKEARNKRLPNIERRKGKKLNIEFVEVDFLEVNLLDMKKWVSKKFDVVSSQFAFHYALKSEVILKNMMKIINELLKRGGYFMMTSFDGEKIYELLKDKKYGEIVKFEGNNGEFAKIRKMWKVNKFQNLGQEIDVYVEKIGVWHIEYLVNFKYLINSFSKLGYKVVEEANFASKLENYKGRDRLSMGERRYIGLHKYLVLQLG